MTDTQKGYKLHIALLDTDYPNTRDIEVSFVTTVEELHRMIQQLYGLHDSVERYLSNDKIQGTREVRPESYTDTIHDMRKQDCVFDGYAWIEAEEVLDAKNTLLAQFISKKYKKVYYTYDLERNMQREISYKGLTIVPLSHSLCTGYEGSYLIEECHIRELDEYKSIYESQDRKRLKEERDWFESRKQFKEYMVPVSLPLSCEMLEKRMNEYVRSSI